MGYRHYFYKVKKADIETVKDMDSEQLLAYAESNGIEIEEWGVKKSFYFNDDKFLNKIEVHEFGKLYWDNTASRIYSKGVPLFTNLEAQKDLDGYEPYVVGKEGLLEAISIYREKVLNFYKNLLVDGEERQLPLDITITKDDVKSIDKVVSHIEDKIRSISYRGFANINEDSKWQVTSSWEYEHSIFNLVHLLKSIDWEKDTLLFYGW